MIKVSVINRVLHDMSSKHIQDSHAFTLMGGQRESEKHQLTYKDAATRQGEIMESFHTE